MAADAAFGVVIRRGPARQVAVLGWNTSTDEFYLGQWFSGRIYERRSDLSPDGRHFIYFAMNGYWDTEMKGSWTAISRAPYAGPGSGPTLTGTAWYGRTGAASTPGA